MEMKGRVAGQGSDVVGRLGGETGRFEPYEGGGEPVVVGELEGEGAEIDEDDLPVGIPPPPEPTAEDIKAQQENYSAWVKYYEDIKQYMIRYAAYHAGLRAQRNVEEALALRAAQAAVATAQHMSIFETRNPARDSKMPKR